MPRALLAAAACAAGLAAGCGSSAKTPTTPAGSPPTSSTSSASGPPMATIGPAGTVGPASSSGYRATKSEVLFGIRVALVRFFTSTGFSGVTVRCKGVNPGVASCDIAGMNRSNQSSSDAITVSINQSNGALRITHVGS